MAATNSAMTDKGAQFTQSPIYDTFLSLFEYLFTKSNDNYWVIQKTQIAQSF